MTTTPVVHHALDPSELLDYVLSHHSHPTTLLICQSRTDFIDSLLVSYPTVTNQSEKPLAKPSCSSSLAEKKYSNYCPRSDPHLILTLDQVAQSRHTNVVFFPTLSHLRAYLSAFPSGTDVQPPKENRVVSDKNVPLLIVYGLLRLHQNTSEWNAQGLGSSLALLVETGRRLSRKVVILEKREKKVDDYDNINDHNNIDSSAGCSERKSLWEENVPILGGSFQPPGMNGERLGLSGRTVNVGRILRRWFKLSN